VFQAIQLAVSASRDSFGDQAWFWIERASWAAAVLGVLGLIVVIAQIRQLIKRPKVRIGFPFDPGGADVRKTNVRDEEAVQLGWTMSSALSDPFELSVSAINEGNATAQNMLFEVRYPVWLVPIGQHQLKQVPTVKNAWTLAVPGIALNPGATHYIRATFSVPQAKSSGTFKLHAIVSMQDAKYIDKTLIVKLS
jgi:hypothetical protein